MSHRKHTGYGPSFTFTLDYLLPAADTHSKQQRTSTTIYPKHTHTRARRGLFSSEKQQNVCIHTRAGKELLFPTKLSHSSTSVTTTRAATSDGRADHPQHLLTRCDLPDLLLLPGPLAGRVPAYLGETEGSDSAVIIQENVNSVQSPSTFSQKT